MSRTPGLLPTGTARVRFQGAAAAAPPSIEALPPDLWNELRARDVAPDTLLAAWEVARWPAAAPIATRRALALLVVALREAARDGSTFLPFATRGAGDERGHPLHARLVRLGLDTADRDAVVALISALASGAAPPAIAALFGAPGMRRPFIVTAAGLYTERIWAVEDRLVAAVAARRASPRRPRPDANAIDAALADVVSAKGAPPLSATQRAAIHVAVSSPLTLVTGGPGTGKTSVVVGLLRTLARLGVAPADIAVCAPTGRAAQRIDESVRAALGRLEAPATADTTLAASFGGASTIHRLLGLRGGRLRGLEPDPPEFHAGWRLPHKVVIADEASMIDLFVGDALFAAVADDAQVVLLGDGDQLPSVDVGALFRDVVAACPELTSRLTESHRMNPADPAGGAIHRIATMLNAGAPIADGIPLRARAADLAFAGVERLAAAHLGALLERWHDEVIPAALLARAQHLRHAVDGDGRLIPARTGDHGGDREGDPEGDHEDNHDGQSQGGDVGALLAAYAAARILCVTRTADRAAGADAINARLHARVRLKVGAMGATTTTGGGVGSTLLPGEPAIVLRNDYERGLFNGDQGVVIRLRGSAGDTLGVAFARASGIVVHPLAALAADLDRAFALTVHKAQGSEYDRIALVLPHPDLPAPSRELLYTAITRARHGVTIVGDSAQLAALPTPRASALAAGLEHAHARDGQADAP